MSETVVELLRVPIVRGRQYLCELSMRIRHIEPGDDLAVSVLLDGYFQGSGMFHMVQQLRLDQDMALECVACKGDDLFGYLAFSKLKSPDNWWNLAIVAVSSAWRQKDADAYMIRKSLEFAREHGAQAVVVVGDPAFYTPLGFAPIAGENIILPFGRERTQIAYLEDTAPQELRRVVYPDAVGQAAKAS
ncbi:GNAT family N-acetyltransferase [Celeribacter naphthalenivorans]|uniref:GNAT family N-acetyltransferase n=1 Tax=Celeribacter naphthalenivorans TaxID=1614694 RepID=UPI001CFBFFD6|nr:N-acetyltransferase [Celeribacter naphthalenivorans]